MTFLIYLVIHAVGSGINLALTSHLYKSSGDNYIAEKKFGYFFLGPFGTLVLLSEMLTKKVIEMNDPEIVKLKKSVLELQHSNEYLMIERDEQVRRLDELNDFVEQLRT